MKKIAIIAAALLFTAAFVHAQAPSVTYTVFMSGPTGWTALVKDGAEGGESGRRRQTQAIRIRATADAVPGTIKYQVNANGRWSDWKYHNEIAGEVGGAPIQAIRIELTGELDDKYDVQYTVFQNGNWTSWIANGADAGVVGQNRYVEAIQVVLTENKSGGKRPQGGRRAAPPPPAPPGGRR